jgi:Plavaka transposase
MKLEQQKEGATIIPLIISLDKTQLTTFQNKAAYPVYLLIGNILKQIRCKPSKQAQILLAYLPMSKLDHIKEDGIRRRATSNLFHTCMKRILEPVIPHSKHGIELVSGDGIVRQCHPIFAAYVGDYPEQVLVVCCMTGHCPKCFVDPKDLASSQAAKKCSVGDALRALSLANDDPGAWLNICKDINLKPVAEPFWASLPFSNIYESITPDILHQLYQGMIKHLISWLKTAFLEQQNSTHAVGVCR